jgi:serine protease Do
MDLFRTRTPHCAAPHGERLASDGNMKQVYALVVACLILGACQRSVTQRSGTGSASREVPNGNALLSGPLLSYANVVDQVAPAVVTIRSSRRVRAPQQFPFFDDPFFRELFGGRPQSRGNSSVEQALGSGVVVRSDGHILTNEHVIDGAEDIKVDLPNRRTYSAKLVGSDAPSDLALLKINASDLRVLELGDSDAVRVGDVCLAVGNPLGVGETVTSGIISAKQRATGLSSGNFEDFLQTDAPINRGNSGGALVNTRGELIGINSQIISPTGASIGIGFAIPSNMAHSVMDQLISKGKVQRGMLGVGIQSVTSDLASGLGLKDVRGVLVNNLTPDGPGEKAGLRAGDVILKLNGKDVNDPNTLRNEIAAIAPGTQVTLTILRNGMQQDVQPTLGELTPQAAEAGQQGQGGSQEGSKLGVGVAPLDPQTAAQLGLPQNTQGIVVESVDPGGPAGQAGLQEGDVITEVNRQKVRTPPDMQRAIAASGNRPPLLLINRKGQTLYLAVPLG